MTYSENIIDLMVQETFQELQTSSEQVCMDFTEEDVQFTCHVDYNLKVLNIEISDTTISIPQGFGPLLNVVFDDLEDGLILELDKTHDQDHILTIFSIQSGYDISRLQLYKDHNGINLLCFLDQSSVRLLVA